MLKQQELAKLVHLPESDWVERKESLPHTLELRKTLVAFANSVPEGEHAILFIGVTDKGVITGISNTDKAQKDVIDTATNHCYPPVKCETTVVQVGAANVVAVVVQRSQNRPHFTGQAYIRRGSRSIRASEEVFADMVASQNDKARVILNHVGRVVSVRETNNPTAGLERDNYGQSLLPVSARVFSIKSCDAHSVEVEDLNYGDMHSVPLTRIEIGKDVIANRLKLIVSGKLD